MRLPGTNFPGSGRYALVVVAGLALAAVGACAALMPTRSPEAAALVAEQAELEAQREALVARLDALEAGGEAKALALRQEAEVIDTELVRVSAARAAEAERAERQRQREIAYWIQLALIVLGGSGAGGGAIAGLLQRLTPSRSSDQIHTMSERLTALEARINLAERRQ